MALNIPNYWTYSVVLSSFAFLVFVLLIVYKTSKSKKFSSTTTFVLLSWFSIVFILGKTGFFAINPLIAPNIIFGFLILFHFLRKIYHSKTIQNIADAIPVHWIIGIQTYRIVGIGFLFLWARQLLPAEFAFPAGIGDIIVGISAPVVALFYYLKKTYATKLAIAWNIVGIADLVIAISVGILGYPRPLQVLPVTPSTDLMSLFPLVIITLFAVPLAMLLHFFSLRVLRKEN